MIAHRNKAGQTVLTLTESESVLLAAIASHLVSSSVTRDRIVEQDMPWFSTKRQDPTPDLRAFVLNLTANL